MFGKGYGLTISSEKNKGTVMMIKIPFQSGVMMYKVLLADDERIILDGISSMIEWNSFGTSFDRGRTERD